MELWLTLGQSSHPGCHLNEEGWAHRVQRLPRKKSDWRLPRGCTLRSGEEGFVSLVSNGRQRATFWVGTKKYGNIQERMFFPQNSLYGSIFPLNNNLLLN